VERSIESDLGRYGMGLSTASLSICQRTIVLTKTDDNQDILKSFTDVNEVNERNEFIKYLGLSDVQDIAFYEKYLSGENSGSIIVLEECDGINNRNTSQFTNKLKKEIARIYRRFMDKVAFIINDMRISPHDPLMIDDSMTEIYSDEDYDIKWKDPQGNEHTDTIRVKLVLLPNYGFDGNEARGINMANQGFYVMRNSREIDSGLMLWYAKHNGYNRFRGELSFNANLDEPMGVDFRKTGINMTDSIENSLKNLLKPQIRAIGNKDSLKSKSNEDEGINHKESADLIAKKSHLLIIPKSQIEKREHKKGTNDCLQLNENNSKEKTPVERKNAKRIQKASPNVRFESHHFTRGGPIMMCIRKVKP